MTNLSKLICRVVFISLSLASVGRAASFYYEFRGTILGSQSFNPSYPTSSLQAIFGVTQVSYLFEIDFNRDNSTFVNSAGTWNFFYTDLIGEGLLGTEIGSTASEVNQGFNLDYNFNPDMGQITGGNNAVRISTTAPQTSRWHVEQWQVGDQFDLTDLANPPVGGGAVYYNGRVSLVSIQAVPEPSTLAVGGLVIVGLLFRRKR